MEQIYSRGQKVLLGKLTEEDTLDSAHLDRLPGTYAVFEY